MSLINDYTHQLLTDQRERDLARLAEHNRQVRLALRGRVSEPVAQAVGASQAAHRMGMEEGLTEGQFIDEIFREVDAFLLGRRTYEIFAAS
jgi:hypothetical protein